MKSPLPHSHISHTVYLVSTHLCNHQYNKYFYKRLSKSDIISYPTKPSSLSAQTLESRLKITLPEDLGEALSNGTVLCQLVNQIRPRSVSIIHIPSPAVVSLASCQIPSSLRTLNSTDDGPLTLLLGNSLPSGIWRRLIKVTAVLKWEYFTFERRKNTCSPPNEKLNYKQ